MYNSCHQSFQILQLINPRILYYLILRKFSNFTTENSLYKYGQDFNRVILMKGLSTYLFIYYAVLDCPVSFILFNLLITLATKIFKSYS